MERPKSFAGVSAFFFCAEHETSASPAVEARVWRGLCGSDRRFPNRCGKKAAFRPAKTREERQLIF
jgi:hypothetical protein